MLAGMDVEYNMQIKYKCQWFVYYYTSLMVTCVFIFSKQNSQLKWATFWGVWFEIKINVSKQFCVSYVTLVKLWSSIPTNLRLIMSVNISIFAWI